MSEKEIKPVAWRYSGLDEEVGFTDDPKWAEAYPDSHAPLYDQQAIDHLKAERDALREDAERYRYLRDRMAGELHVYRRTDELSLLPSELDADIDAARAQEPQA